MSSVNKAILIGNVGSDPEIRHLDRGISIANFSLATTERGYTMQNGTQVPDKPDWHNIVLWRNLADWAERYVKKGMKLYVEGKIKTRYWEKEGQVRHKTEVIADNVQILYRPERNGNKADESFEEENSPYEVSQQYAEANQQALSQEAEMNGETPLSEENMVDDIFKE